MASFPLLGAHATPASPSRPSVRRRRQDGSVAWVVVVEADQGRLAFALGPTDSEAEAAEIKDAVRLPAGWTVAVVELRTPQLIDVRSQLRARRDPG